MSFRYDLASFIRVPVLFHRAKTDQWVPLADVDRFEAALRAQGTTIERHDYAAAHGFFAWNRTGVFSEPEASRAWGHTVQFLRAHAGRPIVPRPLAPSRTSGRPPETTIHAGRASAQLLHVHGTSSSRSRR